MPACTTLWILNLYFMHAGFIGLCFTVDLSEDTSPGAENSHFKTVFHTLSQRSKPTSHPETAGPESSRDTHTHTRGPSGVTMETRALSRCPKV